MGPVESWGARRRVALLALAALVGGCGTPIRAMDPTTFVYRGASFEQTVETVAAGGHEVVLSHPDRWRFGVRAAFRPDEPGDSDYRIAVECLPLSEGIRRCTIRPIGPRVEFYEGRWYLPRPVLQQVEALRRILASVGG